MQIDVTLARHYVLRKCSCNLFRVCFLRRVWTLSWHVCLNENINNPRNAHRNTQMWGSLSFCLLFYYWYRWHHRPAYQGWSLRCVSWLSRVFNYSSKELPWSYSVDSGNRIGTHHPSSVGRCCIVNSSYNLEIWRPINTLSMELHSVWWISDYVLDTKSPSLTRESIWSHRRFLIKFSTVVGLSQVNDEASTIQIRK